MLAKKFLCCLWAFLPWCSRASARAACHLHGAVCSRVLHVALDGGALLHKMMSTEKCFVWQICSRRRERCLTNPRHTRYCMVHVIEAERAHVIGARGSTAQARASRCRVLSSASSMSRVACTIARCSSRWACQHRASRSVASCLTFKILTKLALMSDRQYR